MSPIAGFTRLRKHQFGRQVTFGTVVPAVAAFPFRGVPSVDLQWTDPDVDAGVIDLTVAPTREGGEFGAPLAANALEYNSLPLMLAAFFGGGVLSTPTGAGFTWDFAPASLTVDPFDVFTYEFGDDVLTDWFQLGDGILERLEFTGPEGLGTCTASMSWTFGSAASTGSTDNPVTGTVPTPDLAVDANAARVYLKDMAIFIGDAPDDLDQVMDALHTFTLRFSQTLDRKRFANGDQSFAVDAYGRTGRTIELECTFAKVDTVTVGLGSEADHWMSDQTVDRYVRLMFTSTRTVDEASDGIPYSWDVRFPMRYYTRTDGEVGGNTTVVLTGKAWFDPDLFDGIFTSEIINTLERVEQPA